MSIIRPLPSEPTLEPPPALFAETMAMIAIEGLDVTEEGCVQWPTLKRRIG